MEKLITKSIVLSFINNKKKLYDVEIPFSNVFVLEMENITTNIGHTSKGEFLEFYICGVLNLRLYKDKIDKSVLENLKDSILSITLKFNDNTSKSYNVVWDSTDGIVNTFQDVKEKDNIIEIFIA